MGADSPSSPLHELAPKSSSTSSPTQATRCIKLHNWPGTYATLSTATHSPKVAFVYSNLGKPEEVYLADSTGKLNDARPITSFNKLLPSRSAAR